MDDTTWRIDDSELDLAPSKSSLLPCKSELSMIIIALYIDFIRPSDFYGEGEVVPGIWVSLYTEKLSIP